MEGRGRAGGGGGGENTKERSKPSGEDTTWKPRSDSGVSKTPGSLHPSSLTRKTQSSLINISIYLH